MEAVIKFLEENSGNELEPLVIVEKVTDSLFDSLRKEVGESLIILNRSRKLIRKGNPKDKQRGIADFDLFRSSWISMGDRFNKLKELVKGDKSIDAIGELLMKSVSRDVFTKIPQSPLNYLDKSEVDESDVDWIIKKIKDYWGKYAQIYSSTRFNYLLRID